MIKLNSHYDELSKCSKCGFCQVFCPVYAVTGIETMTARGRNAQLMGVIEGSLSISEIQYALSSCLLCRACLPNCYSGVRTDEIVRAGREALVEAKASGISQEIFLNCILPYPVRLAVFQKITLFLKKTRLIRFAEKLGVVPEFFESYLMEREHISGSYPMPLASSTVVSSLGEKNVAYFKSCGFSYLLPETAKATIKVIEALEYPIIVPENNCCGLPPYAHGYTDVAIDLAKKNIEILEKYEIILTECGSCSSFLKKYADLLSDDHEYAERAKKVSARVMDSNEFIFKHVDLIQSAFRNPHSALRVTYHDPCHLSRYQGITKEPREIIKSISGIEFVELPEADWCCGGAGSYSILNNEISMKILDRKMNNLKETGADILVTSCPSCMLQLSQGVRRAGLDVRVMHVNQLLAQALD